MARVTRVAALVAGAFTVAHAAAFGALADLRSFAVTAVASAAICVVVWFSARRIARRIARGLEQLEAARARAE